MKQLNIKTSYDLIFDWIPYNELVEIKEIGKVGFFVEIWKEGSLHYDVVEKEWIKEPKKVVLKYLSDSQNITDESLNEATTSIDCYGISQNPNTKDYILVVHNKYYNKYCKECDKEYTKLNHKCCESCLIKYLGSNLINWTSGNEKIDDFIRKRQLKTSIESSNIFEWIPYNKFIEIKKVGDNCLTTAIWKEGPLIYNTHEKKWMRTLSKKVFLKYLSYSQNVTDEFINNKIESYLTNKMDYGVSQNPDTRDYILVFNIEYFDYYCEKCGNEYEKCDNEYEKWKLNEEVLLKYLYGSQNINNKFLNEITYLVEESYGISQDPNTNDSILVLQFKYYCKNCGKKYNYKFEIDNKSCISCQTKCENKKINDLIQEMKLNVDYYYSKVVFEWIPYDQFDDIKEIGKGGFSIVYSAIWKNGLLDSINKIRIPNTKVALKYLNNSQNFLDEFINEVKVYSNSSIGNILKIYGISQNPNTKDYIMVFEYAEGGDFNNYLNKNYEKFDWFNGLKVLNNIAKSLNGIHQKQMVHRDFHTGNILFMNNNLAHISDMGLCKKIDDINEANIYGVMPYVAPEVLKGKPYTQAADIYSFGMIMYVVATGRQPFDDCAHDEFLVLKICNEIRPEINEKIAPKCYINLMKKCWDGNPGNRPNSIEIKEMIELFYNSLDQKNREYQKSILKNIQQLDEIKEKFEETQEYRKEYLLSIKKNKSTTHTQAIYRSRLLNPYTKNISSTVEITDFTNL
ncbi:uncharacterized protein OCT59_002676 [Rhizophagus irregularis]|nr:hypothetical protein OCT59_002676 [Rhizophagus irregularis]